MNLNWRKLLTEKTILITGGAGFIGHNFIKYYSAKYPKTIIIDLDALTYASNHKAWEEQKSIKNVITVTGNICNHELLNFLFKKYDISGVIHFAAEGHVDNSIKRPLDFMNTNVVGIATLINEATNYWRNHNTLETSRFHHVSTDEVFGSLNKDGYFSESSPYSPNSPYSASKASSDMIVYAYAKTFGTNITISNCSNNYGPWQNTEKFIPTVIKNCLSHSGIPIYGNGLNIRDWLYVEDHCKAIDTIFNYSKKGEKYNIGGHCEKSNINLAQDICNILNELLPWHGHNYLELINFVKDRPGHDFRYAIDSSKLFSTFSWNPNTSYKEGLKRTVQWYMSTLI